MPTASSTGPERAHRLLLAGAVALAAALRFTALDARGWWRDEAVTVELLRLPFGELLRTIPESEGTPPLYYVLAWGWTRVFGDSEAGLRSLSALLGTLAVVVVYLAARELVSRRAGLVVAYLAAASPLLVWHAQDGRSYSLLVLLGALSFLFFVRLRKSAAPVDAVGFALASALALTTHYFAAFLVVPEVAWLLAGTHTRRVAALPVAAVAAVGTALVPLALAQRGNVDWISEVPRWRRLVEVVQELLVGPQAPWERVTTVAAAVLAAAAVGLLLLRADRGERRAAVPAAAVGGGAVALPLMLALFGLDYVLGRNLIVAWAPLAIVAAAGLASRRAGVAGLAVSVALVALGAGVIVGSAGTPKFGAEDWRGAARALGPPPPGGRAIVLWPPEGRGVFALYRPRAAELDASGETVSEVVVATLGPRRRDLEGLGRAVLPPSPPFRLVDRVDGRHFTLTRFRAAAPVVVEPAELLAPTAGVARPALLYER